LRNLKTAHTPRLHETYSSRPCILASRSTYLLCIVCNKGEKKNLISLVESRGMIVHVCIYNGNLET